MDPLYNNWIDIFSALLLPVIALIAIWIAYQQYKTTKQRLQHELYESRLRVYKAVQSFLAEIVRKGDADYKRCYQFYADSSEASFLFDETIKDYIEELFDKAANMHGHIERMYPADGSEGLPAGEERSLVDKETEELLAWLSTQLQISKGLFAKYMKMK